MHSLKFLIFHVPHPFLKYWPMLEYILDWESPSECLSTSFRVDRHKVDSEAPQKDTVGHGLWVALPQASVSQPQAHFPPPPPLLMACDITGYSQKAALCS